MVTDSPGDPKAGTWVSWLTYQGMDLAMTELWYAEPDGQDAAIFDRSNRIASLSDTMRNRTLAEYTAQIDAVIIDGFREMYYSMTTKASPAVAEAAREIFFENRAVLGLDGALPVMIWQAFTEGK